MDMLKSVVFALVAATLFSPCGGADTSSLRADVRELVKWIWAHPELSWQEHQTCATQVEFLRSRGFSVTTNYLGLATSYRAEFANGAEHPCFAFAVEYDALPDVGHACGHNLNCGNAISAAFLLREKMLSNGVAGKIVLLGCPAEEGGCGKGVLAERGATADIDAMMMSHATPGDCALGDPGFAGVRIATVVYRGTGGSGVARCANPKFTNPLDAQTLLYHAVAMRRHFLPDDMAVIGVISEAGKAANVLPPETKSEYTVRCQNVAKLDAYEAEFRRMAEGAAMMTGTTLEFTYKARSQPTKANWILGDFYLDRMRERGYKIDYNHECRVYSATDFGNLSQLVPAVHGHFPIFSDAACHTAAFAKDCNLDRVYKPMFDSAEAMAATAFAYISDEAFRSRVNEFFHRKAK